MSAEKLRDYFYLSQIVLGVLFLAAAWFMLGSRNPRTFFKDRSSDSAKPVPRPLLGTDDELANASMRKNQPLRLTGISIEGEPHEILGVQRTAGVSEIQKAYRDLMKRYHPDLVGPPGSRQWKDAQKIAEALNRAKDALMKKSR